MPEGPEDEGPSWEETNALIAGVGPDLEVQRMVEEERDCPDILQQCAAVHSALRAAEKVLLANHLERCATHALAEGGEAAVQVRKELVDVFHRYLR